MKVDELIKQKAEELHRVHAHDSGRLDELTARARPRRRSQVSVLIGTALAVLLLFGPVALLLRSEDPTSSTVDGDSTPAESSGEVSMGERLFEVPGDGGLGRIMSSGSDLIVTGFDIVLRSVDEGDTWEVTGGSPSGDDSLIITEAANGTLLAVGAHDGASSRLYRSDDYGATWEQFELPVPPEVVQAGAFVIAHWRGEFFIAGVGTQGSFDSDVTLYLWRSSDAVDWEFEEVIDLEGRFAYSEAVQIVDDRLVIISRIANDTSIPTLLAFEETASGWNQVDLSSIIWPQAGLSSDLINAQLKGVGIIDERVHTWWGFDSGTGASTSMAMAYQTESGLWKAESVTGVLPETITITNDRLIGTAHPGTFAPSMTPGFTAIVVSSEGVSWTEIGRVDGLYLRQIRPVDDTRFIAAGNETEPSGEGFTVPSSGMWEIELSEDIANILNSQ